MTLSLAAIIAAGVCPTVIGDDGAGPLPRRGCLGAQVASSDEGVVIVGVVPDGPARRAGINATDRIIAVDGNPVGSDAATTFLRGHSEGDEVRLTVRRGPNEMEVVAKLAAPRTPDLPGALTEFGEVTIGAGPRVRSIITTPFPPVDRPQPAVLFVQHTDCATIDPDVARENGWTDLIETIAQSGYVTMRIDKPGVGDSDGPDCGTLDYLGELDVFRAALAALVADHRVDPTRVFLVAHRGGTTIAPILAQEFDFAGVCAIGPVIRPWYEHTLDLMRRQSRDWNMPPNQAEKMLHDCAALLARVIVLGEEPADVVREHPELAQLARSLGGDRLLGRCAAFHRQLNDAELAANWTLAETDVLVLRGEYDRYTTVEDQELVARLVNGPTGTYAWTATIPKTDPDLNPQAGPDYYKTKWSAITEGPNPELREIVLDWMVDAGTNTTPGNTGQGYDPGLQVERDAPAKPES